MFPEAHMIQPGRCAGDFAGLQTQLGANLYAKEKSAGAQFGAHEAAAAASAAAAVTAASSADRQRIDSAATERAIRSGDQAQQSRKDLNLLADLIGAGAQAAPMDAFKLNLFPDTSLDFAGVGGASSGVPTITIDIGTKALQSSNQNLMGIMDEMSQMHLPSHDPEGDDLLDLMDAAQ
mmetsp:Transcript_3456/g.7517  ORF Transcript_3456/g.7517 Transcript_3456/m.7517 type:complete len:178 (-) Transcript_3456:265-798(-)